MLSEHRTIQGATLNVTPPSANDLGLNCVRTGQGQCYQPPDQTGSPQVFEKPRQLPHAVVDRPGYETAHFTLQQFFIILTQHFCWQTLCSSAGLKNILEVAGTVPELSDGPPLTDNSHMSCSVLLSKLYDDLKSDKERENFNNLCEEFVQ